MNDEFDNVFFVPQNFTDSGKSIYGMFNTRNLVEAIAVLVLIGYPEMKFLPFQTSIKVVIMIITLIPLVLFALIGIDGDSFVQFCEHVFMYLKNRRKMHFRRVGYKYAEETAKSKNKKK